MSTRKNRTHGALSERNNKHKRFNNGNTYKTVLNKKPGEGKDAYARRLVR